MHIQEIYRHMTQLWASHEWSVEAAYGVANSYHSTYHHRLLNIPQYVKSINSIQFKFMAVLDIHFIYGYFNKIIFFYSLQILFDYALSGKLYMEENWNWI